VGAVSTACLARDGHAVIGVDIDENKLSMLRAGISPVVEEGMPELVREAAGSGNLSVTSDVVEAIRSTDLTFICVGTPSRPNGSQDLSAVLRVSDELGEALAAKGGYHLLVMRSTVTPGTVEETIRPIVESKSGLREGTDFDLCFLPEFLREGSSIRDYDNPPYTIIGSRSDRANRVLGELFGHLPCEIHQTSIRTAEMLKYASNVFHATKITFANELGRLCRAYGVDSHQMMDLFCRDDRLNISPAYLRPGFAFGGSCLPKDLRALLYLAKARDVELPMLSSVPMSNAVHVQQAIEMVLQNGRPRVGLLGLSFKTGTDDLRESPLVSLAEHFIGKGLELSIYDEEVILSRLMGANKRFIESTIPHIADLMNSDCGEVVRQGDVIVVGNRGNNIVTTLHREVRPGQLVVDLVRIPDHEKLRCRYAGVCW
jgi:GDP-mannose 6-dehydrogenase